MFALPLTDSAVLRPLEPWHAEEFLAHLDRAREHILPWVSPSFVAADVDKARAVLQGYADKRAHDGGGIWGIWLDGHLVGGVMFVSFDTALGVCEAGCWLEPGAQGRGLITRATQRIIDWAIDERGIARVEWRTKSANERSIAVARRLGMSHDGTLRQVYPDGAGGRIDLDIWSVLAAEWRARRGSLATATTPPAGVKAELDGLMATFLGAFTNLHGTRPNVEAIYEVFIPDGMIIKNVGGTPTIYDLGQFVEPREKILTDGTLTEFHEWETSETTEISGSIAHRFSQYRKSGYLNGGWFQGQGTKTTQFVNTPSGWKMSSLAWDDETAPAPAMTDT